MMVRLECKQLFTLCVFQIHTKAIVRRCILSAHRIRFRRIQQYRVCIRPNRHRQNVHNGR